MPPRVPRGRLRELEARQRRAEEGWARFEAAQRRLASKASRHIGEDSAAMENPALLRFSREMLDEMLASLGGDAQDDPAGAARLLVRAWCLVC